MTAAGRRRLLGGLIAFRSRAWAVVAIAACCGASLLPGCHKEPPASSNISTAITHVGDHSEIEQPLTNNDISVSFAPSIKQLKTVPATIRVRYRNESAKRGYFELPKTFRPIEKLKGLVVAIGMRGVDGSEPVFIYYENKADEHQTGPIAVLDAKASVIVDYPAENFCLIGHGIAPDPAANLKSCYHSGDESREMRVYLMPDLDPMNRIASQPLTIKLSKPDFSMHRELQDSASAKGGPNAESR